MLQHSITPRDDAALTGVGGGDLLCAIVVESMLRRDETRCLCGAGAQDMSGLTYVCRSTRVAQVSLHIDRRCKTDFVCLKRVAK